MAVDGAGTKLFVADGTSGHARKLSVEVARHDTRQHDTTRVTDDTSYSTCTVDW